MGLLAKLYSFFGTNSASENAVRQPSARTQTWSDIFMGGQSRAHFGDNYHYTYAHPPEPPKSKRLLEIQSWLGGTRNQSSQYEDIGIPVGAERPAGAWFLNDERFTTWQTEPNSWLWLYGIPGCGKTVLNAKAVQYLRERWKPEGGVVIHFYFDFRARQNDVDFMLRSLLLQLLDQSHETFAQMDQLFELSCGGGARQPTRSELLQALQFSLEAESKVYIALDALDECDSAEDEHLGAVLEQMHDWDLQATHFLITSRQDGFAYSALNNIVSLHYQVLVRRQDVDRDIEAWVKVQLSSRGRLGRKLSGWYPQHLLKKRIRTRLLNKASGMFLLTKLQLSELERCYNIHDIEEKLLEMPETVGAMYDRILEKICGTRQQQYAKDILTWIAFARRPLYVQELEWAIAFSLNERSEVTIDPDKRLQNGAIGIFDICHSLVGLLDDPMGRGEGLRSSQKVELAHSTVKDYITSTGQKWSSSWLGTLQSESSHRLIAQSLLAYLEYLSEYRWNDVETARWSREFSLAWYAIHVWPEHASLSGTSPDSLGLRFGIHRQMERLILDERALGRLIELFEPQKVWDDQLRDKALQDLKIVWCFTSRMRLGRMVQMSIPPKIQVESLSQEIGQVRKSNWTVSQKLGHVNEIYGSAIRQRAWEWTSKDPWHCESSLRESMRGKGKDWESELFLDLSLTMAEVLSGGEMKTFWDDSDLAVAVVKFDCPGKLPPECQLPVVIHVPFLEKAKQAPVPGEGDLRKSAES